MKYMIYSLMSLMIYLLMVGKLMMSGKHLLMMLLSLEGMMIMIMYFVVKSLFFGVLSIMGVLVYLVVMVSEGALGLSVSVMLVRGVGCDKIFYFNLL